jgi:hypothetical protein
VREEIVEFVLKDFPGARYYPKFRLMTWHPMGIFDAALADKLREFIEREEHLQNAPFDRYADLSGVAQVRISLERLSEVASRRRSALQPVKSAVFADKKHTFVIARIYESLMEDAMAITVRAFRERELAAHWLGVPLAILRPPAKRA